VYPSDPINGQDFSGRQYAQMASQGVTILQQLWQLVVTGASSAVALVGGLAATATTYASTALTGLTNNAQALSSAGQAANAVGQGLKGYGNSNPNCSSILTNCGKGGNNPFSNIKYQITDKIRGQMADRKWTDELIERIVKNPAGIGSGINKANGNPAIVFFRDPIHYISIDSITNEIIQITDLRNQLWILDNTILTPFK